MATKRKPAPPPAEGDPGYVKPGASTSEFWLTAGTIAGTVLTQFIPAAEAVGPKTAAVTSTVAASIYALTRAWAKVQARKR